MKRICLDRMVGRLRQRMSRRAVMAVLLCFILSLYGMFSLIKRHHMSRDRWYKHPARCMTPKYIMDEMVVLTSAVSNVLTKLNVSHALCYGTLWGALRYGRILPWDTNVDFCVLKTEIETVPWDRLQEAFRANHMGLTFNLRHGEYLISRGPAKAVLTVFYESHSGEAQRDGIEHKFLNLFQTSPRSFHARLLKPPFNKVAFHGQLLPVPREDMEILKNLYPDDWWLEKPPVGCPMVNMKASSLG